jgi:hypothetical protein
MKLLNYITFALLFYALIECKSAPTGDPKGDGILNDQCLEKPQADCMCTRQYAPVCGCNNKTYGNSCEAECNGITSYSDGECAKGK